jgi:septal ring factor EnvC (AmiA/AmiB activator)
MSSSDLVSMQMLVSEHAQLKENLQKTNIAMRKNFQSIQNWQEQIKSMQAAQCSKIDDQQKTIDLVSKNVLFLHGDIIIVHIIVHFS